jgi:hypothetical protein
MKMSVFWVVEPCSLVLPDYNPKDSHLPISQTLKMAAFWVVMPYSLVEVYRRFRCACCLHHQGGQEIPCLLWNPEGSLPCSQEPATGFSLRQMNLVHILSSYFRNILFNIILQSTLFRLSNQNYVRISYLAFYMPSQSHSP